MAKIPIPWNRFAPRWSAKHHAQDALAMALASALAYEKSSVVKARLHGEWGFASAKTVSVRKGGDIDTHAFIADDGQHILIAFRGSASKANWIANFQAVTDPGPFKKTRVHEGFQDTLFPGVLGLTKLLQERRSSSQAIWITGHSLGGALAALFAGMLRENGIDVAGLYTFGAPRAGNRHFARELNAALEQSNHFRYANEHDLVPHVPPEPLFDHAGNRRLLRADKPVSGSRSLWIRFKKSFVEWWNEVTDGDLVVKDAHLLDTDIGYIARLRKAAEGS